MYERRGVSREAAEALCERLERAGAIRFNGGPPGEIGWRIDPDVLAGR